MNAREVAELLTVVSAFDNRTISTEMVTAWAALLGDVGLEDATARVKRHYQSNTRWLMPADLRPTYQPAKDDLFCPFHANWPHPDSFWGCGKCRGEDGPTWPVEKGSAA